MLRLVNAISVPQNQDCLTHQGTWPIRSKIFIATLRAGLDGNRSILYHHVSLNQLQVIVTSLQSVGICDFLGR